MNATEVLTIATATPPATTPREDTTALVKKDTLEMDRIAQVCFMFVCVACFTFTSVERTDGSARTSQLVSLVLHKYIDVYILLGSRPSTVKKVTPLVLLLIYLCAYGDFHLAQTI